MHKVTTFVYRKCHCFISAFFRSSEWTKFLTLQCACLVSPVHLVFNMNWKLILLGIWWNFKWISKIHFQLQFIVFEAYGVPCHVHLWLLECQVINMSLFWWNDIQFQCSLIDISHIVTFNRPHISTELDNCITIFIDRYDSGITGAIHD